MRTIDTLNNIQTEYIDIETYFDAMDITEAQKEVRKSIANDVWWVFLLLFSTIKVSVEEGNLDYEYIFALFRENYTDTVLNYAKDDEYIREYINRFTQDAMDVTWARMDITGEDDYWLSTDRAMLNGLNEANSIMNYEELRKAIEEGYTKKKWVAELDKRTRKDHIKMDKKTIPIKEKFKFPDCEMIMPHDEVNGTARQCSNCRCSLKFIK